MKFQQSTIINKVVFCLILLFFGLMSVSVTYAEIYTPITTWGSPGTENGQFNYPSDIAVDSLGNVYVTDTNNNRIQKFDSSGAYITQWGSPGTENGQFWIPSGVAVDSSGNVYVTEAANNRVQNLTVMTAGLLIILLLNGVLLEAKTAKLDG